MSNLPELYEFTSMIDFANHMIDEHGMNHASAYTMDRFKLHDLHIEVHSGLNKNDLRRILDILLTINNGDPYPVNDTTQSHIEEIVTKIDNRLDTGWAGFGYTIWMEGVEP